MIIYGIIIKINRKREDYSQKAGFFAE